MGEPLFGLCCDSVPFTWGPEKKQVFEDLKKALTKASVLHFLRLYWLFCIKTDVRGVNFGEALTKDWGLDIYDHVAYASRTLQDAKRRYSDTKREELSFFWAVY